MSLFFCPSVGFQSNCDTHFEYYTMHNVFKLCTVMFYGFASGHKFDIDHQTQCVNLLLHRKSSEIKLQINIILKYYAKQYETIIYIFDFYIYI